MGRFSSRTANVRSVLRSFDNYGIVSPHGNALANLLNVDWNGFLARGVLKESSSIHPSLHGIIGCDTVSTKTLVNAYEPSLVRVVEDLIELQGIDALASRNCELSISQERDSVMSEPVLHDPLFCCALFGWDKVCEILLNAGADPSVPGEHGMSSWACATAHGWFEVAAQLQNASASFSPRRCIDPKEGGALQSGGFEPFCPFADPTMKSSQDWERMSFPRVSVPIASVEVQEVDGRDLSVGMFMREFFFAKRPLVIRGGAGAVPILQWSLDDMLDALGTCEGKYVLSPIPYPDDFLPLAEAQAVTLSCTKDNLLQSKQSYLFQEVEDGSELHMLLRRDLKLQEMLPTIFHGEGQVHSQQLSLGQSGTGAPWHWHQDAFNTCIAGERVWYFRPPAQALMSRQQVTKGVPQARTSLCTIQRPGDIVYVPELWSHSVVNITLSCAVALEFGTVM